MTTSAAPPPAPRGSALLGVLPELKRDTLGLLERVAPRARRRRPPAVAGPPRHAHHDLRDLPSRRRPPRARRARRRLPQGQPLLRGDPVGGRRRAAQQPGRAVAAPAALHPAAVHAQADRGLRGDDGRGGRGGRPRAGATPPRTGEPVDVHAEMSRLTLRIVGGCCSAPTWSARCPSSRRSFPVLGEHARRRAYNPASPPRSWPTPANRRAAQAQAGDVRRVRRADRGPARGAQRRATT